MARILVAGCGDLGVALGLRLAGRGHEVFGLRRRAEALPSPLRPLAADLLEPRTLAALPDALDTVFFTAAPSRPGVESYRRVYHDGLGNLLEALRRQRGGPPRRILFTSSTSVYAQDDGGFVDEGSPAKPVDPAAQWLRAAEERAWAFPAEAVVVRLAGIYGPGRTRLIEQVRSGAATYVPGLYTNRIHRDDAAALLAHLGGLVRPSPLYLGVDDAPALQGEVLGWLAQRLGLPPPSPRPSPGASEVVRRSNKRCRNARTRASGFELAYPTYRHGYAPLCPGAID